MNCPWLTHLQKTKKKKKMKNQIKSGVFEIDFQNKMKNKTPTFILNSKMKKKKNLFEHSINTYTWSVFTRAMMSMIYLSQRKLSKVFFLFA